MLIRKVTDADGECFALTPQYDFGNRCKAMAEGKESDKCGTYECPFYKPYGCEDWVRIEKDGEIIMYTPEEMGLI